VKNAVDGKLAGYVKAKIQGLQAKVGGRGAGAAGGARGVAAQPWGHETWRRRARRTIA
jgi:hypothetical protein